MMSYTKISFSRTFTNIHVPQRTYHKVLLTRQKYFRRNQNFLDVLEKFLIEKLEFSNDESLCLEKSEHKLFLTNI